jgi:hypothetical protein
MANPSVPLHAPENTDRPSGGRRPKVSAPLTSPEWSWGTRIAFRFFVAYLLLYFFPRFLWELPFTDGLYDLWSAFIVGKIWNPLARWVGNTLLHNDPGSPGLYNSDFHVALIVSFALIAAVVTTIWTAADRRRAHPRLLVWFSVFMRFTLAALMVGYGVQKVFLQQFDSPPQMLWMYTPFGAFTPHMTMASFMGTSVFYQVLTGIIELLAGILLMLRRTSLLGGVLTVAVMANVFAMNYGYRFGVGLFSANILLMGLVLIAPDIRRLLEFVTMHRGVTARIPEPLFNTTGRRRVATAAGISYLLWVVGTSLRAGAADLQEDRQYAAGETLLGAWDVETAIVNGDTIPPLLTDTTRWRRMILDVDATSGTVWVQPMQDLPLPLKFTTAVVIDTAQRRFAFTWPDKTAISWTYTRPDSERVELAGKWFHVSAGQPRRAKETTDSVRLTLRRIDESTLRLLKAVPWINR